MYTVCTCQMYSARFWNWHLWMRAWAWALRIYGRRCQWRQPQQPTTHLNRQMRACFCVRNRLCIVMFMLFIPSTDTREYKIYDVNTLACQTTNKILVSFRCLLCLQLMYTYCIYKYGHAVDIECFFLAFDVRATNLMSMMGACALYAHVCVMMRASIFNFF